MLSLSREHFVGVVMAVVSTPKTDQVRLQWYVCSHNIMKTRTHLYHYCRLAKFAFGNACLANSGSRWQVLHWQAKNERKGRGEGLRVVESRLRQPYVQQISYLGF